MTEKMENPWNIQSIYELQYFNCPSCPFKNHSKQEIVNHAFECHPESVSYLSNITDSASFRDIVCPWTVIQPTINFGKFDKNKMTYKIEEIGKYIYQQDFHQQNVKLHFLDPNAAEYNRENVEKKDKAVTKYKCNQCERAYTQAHNLKLHIKSVHEGIKKTKKYNCYACEKVFTQSHNLKLHIKRVHEETKILKPKEHQCYTCHKAFTEQHNLKLHIKTVHEKLKEYRCHFCSKAFTQSHNLKLHLINVHEGQKEFLTPSHFPKKHVENVTYVTGLNLKTSNIMGNTQWAQ